MKKVVISGYYGFHNAGDEAILESLSLQLKKAGIEVLVLSACPEETLKTYGIKSFNRFKFKEVIRAIKECDGVISGGGSLFQDVTSSGSLYYYLGTILLAKIMKKKVFVYSQGIGPIKSKLNQKILTMVLNKTKFISVRDRNSYNFLKEIGVKISNILVTADPVFLLESAGIEQGVKILLEAGLDINNEENVIGLALRPWGDRKIATDNFAEIGDKIIEKFNAKLVFFPFHYPQDLEFASEIAKKMKNKVFIINKQYRPSKIMSAMGLMNINIGVRLHSLIFSAKLGVPMVGISYDPKVEGFLDSIGFDVMCGYQNLEWNKIKEAIKNTNNNREVIIKQINEQKSKKEELAKQNLEQLIKGINK